MKDLEDLFNDAMAWGMVYGEILCASKCWNEERDKKAKEYAKQAKELMQNTEPLKSLISRQKHQERVKKELEEDEGYSQAMNSGGRDYD